jgi:acyl carrier protein
MDDITQTLRQIVLTEFLQGESEANLADDAPLRSGGILDSVATLKLVSLLEERFGIEIDAHEAGVENFDRITDIAALVARKLAAKAKSGR